MTAMAHLAASIRRAPMFRDRSNAIATAILGAAIAYAGFRLVKWGIVNAIWSLPQDGGSEACRAARGEVRAGQSSPSAFASSCLAPIRSASSGVQPSRVCCS